MRAGDKRGSQRRKRVALQTQFVVVVAATPGHVVCTERTLEGAAVAHAAAVPAAGSARGRKNYEENKSDENGLYTLRRKVFFSMRW